MTSIHAFVVAAALTAGGLVATAAGATAADADPTTTVENGKTVLKVSEVAVDIAYTPKGGPTVTTPPTAAPSPGSELSFANDLVQDKVKVGGDKGTCKVGAGAKAYCDVTLTFARGSIRVFGDADFSSTVHVVPLSSGSGAWSGVNGTVTIVDHANFLSDLTLRYTVPGSAAGGQVAEVPTGGARTGGGDHGQDSRLALLGLGAGVLAAGAGLVGAGRRVGRRR